MVLDGSSSNLAHAGQNAFLIVLSLLFLPLNTAILLASYLITLIHGKRALSGAQQTPNLKNILVTGVGMTKGLSIARQFHLAGHRVIGADFESNAALSPGRFSVGLEKFYRLQKPTPAFGGSAPYIQGLLDVILKERMDVWVSCSGVASAVEDGEAKEIIEKRTKCRSIQFDVATTQMLHEKHTFVEHTRAIGLNVPETHTITSRKAVDEALRNAPQGRKYIMKTIGMDDANRGNLTLLPKGNDEATRKHLDRLRISEEKPWILQQFVKGREFCTHSLVVRGKVQAFVACPSKELLMHYKALSADSALSRAMLQFTETFAANGGESFTGHLSFDFSVEDTTPTDPEKIVLYSIECNPRAHTAVCLFNGTPKLVDGYLDLLENTPKTSNGIVTPTYTTKYHWIGHDLIELVIVALINLLQFRASFSTFLRKVADFILYLVHWKDGTYELWDPMPWWALHHLYCQMQFLHYLRTGKKWGRLNVSTLKMFEC